MKSRFLHVFLPLRLCRWEMVFLATYCGKRFVAIMRCWKCIKFWLDAARASSFDDLLALWQARSHRWTEEVEVMHETRVSLVLGVASPGRGKRLYHWNIFLYNLCRHNQKGTIMKKK